MYKRKMLSAITAVAIMSTGAIGFDMLVNEDKNGNIDRSIASIVVDRVKDKTTKLVMYLTVIKMYLLYRIWLKW